MIGRKQKLDAIYNFGTMVAQNPWLAFLMGYLIGQVDRVHFLQDLEGAEVAIRVSAGRATVWPGGPFKATVRGITMPNTYVLVRSIPQDETPICVCLDFDKARETDWYQSVLLPSSAFIEDAEEAAHHESETLWREMDRTLDIYRECRSMLQDDPERKRELEYYMRTAEEQMKRISRHMDELNRQMKRISESQ